MSSCSNKLLDPLHKKANFISTSSYSNCSLLRRNPVFHRLTTCEQAERLSARRTLWHFFVCQIKETRREWRAKGACSCLCVCVAGGGTVCVCVYSVKDYWLTLYPDVIFHFREDHIGGTFSFARITNRCSGWRWPGATWTVCTQRVSLAISSVTCSSHLLTVTSSHRCVIDFNLQD